MFEQTPPADAHREPRVRPVRFQNIANGLVARADTWQNVTKDFDAVTSAPYTPRQMEKLAESIRDGRRSAFRVDGYQFDAVTRGREIWMIARVSK